MSEIDQQIEQLTAQINELSKNQQVLMKKIESSGTAALMKSIESMRKGLAVNMRESTRGDLDQLKQDLLSQLQNNGDNSSGNLTKAASLIAAKVDSISSFDVARTSDLVSLSKSIKEYGEGFKSNSGDMTELLDKKLSEKLATAISKTDLERFGGALIKQFSTLSSKNAGGISEAALNSALEDLSKKTVKRDDLEKLAAGLISRLSVKEDITTTKDLSEFNTNLAANLQKMFTELKNSNLQTADLEKFGQKLVTINNQNLNKSLEKIDISDVIVGKLKQDQEFVKSSDIANIEKQIVKEISGMKSSSLSRKDLEDLGKSLVSVVSKDKDVLNNNFAKFNELAKNMLTSEHLVQANKNILTTLKPLFESDKNIQAKLDATTEQLARNAKQLNLSEFGKSLIGEIDKRTTSAVSTLPNTEQLNQFGKSLVDAVGQHIKATIQSVDQRELLEKSFTKLAQLNSDNLKKLHDQVLSASIPKSDINKLLTHLENSMTVDQNKAQLGAFGKQVLTEIHGLNKQNNAQLVEDLLQNIDSSNATQVTSIEDKVAELILNLLSGIDDRFETQTMSFETLVRQIGNIKELEENLKAIKDKVSNLSVNLDDDMLNQLTKSVTETLRKEGGIGRKDLIELDEKVKSYTKGAASAVVSANKKQLDEMNQKLSSTDVSHHINIALGNITKMITSVKTLVMGGTAVVVAGVLVSVIVSLVL